MEKVPKNIFVLSLRNFTNENEAIALSTDGKMLVHIVYKEENDIPYEFGLKGTNQKHYHLFNQLYPDGWTITYIPSKDVTNNKELATALKKFIDSEEVIDKEYLW